MDWIGLDIGGANLKAASSKGGAVESSFPLWKQPELLSEALFTLLSGFSGPSESYLAITMTGELADCYPTKRQGVQHILNSVKTATLRLPHLSKQTTYQCGGRFVTLEKAAKEDQILKTAASNWHALANYCRRFLTKDKTSGFLIDIGSSTSDLIPFSRNEVLSLGATDFERLKNSELIYTGGKRTPLCALTKSVLVDGFSVRLAAEFFATTEDVYLTLGKISEDLKNTDTADGKPQTCAYARARIARMLCLDQETFSPQEAVEFSLQIQKAQIAELSEGARQLFSRQNSLPDLLVLSGSAEHLSRDLVEQLIKHHPTWNPQILSLNKELNKSLSTCAPAYALAVLASEQEQLIFPES